jgi:porphobilinogen synthase
VTSESYETSKRPTMIHRMRRLRRLEATRRLVKETRLSTSDLVYPIFVDARISAREAIPSMPGIYRYALTELEEELARSAAGPYRMG